MAASVRKLIVEVIGARNLRPKDGHGTSSAYVVADFDGQRRRTRTVPRDLNPEWKEVLEFRVDGCPDANGEPLEIDLLHDRGPEPKGNNFLGRLRLESRDFVRKGEEALIYYPLEKKSFFNWVRGELGLKIYFVDAPPPPPPPTNADTPPSVDPPPPTAAGNTNETVTPSPPAAAGNTNETATPPPSAQEVAATEKPQPPPIPESTDGAAKPDMTQPAEEEENTPASPPLPPPLPKQQPIAEPPAKGSIAGTSAAHERRLASYQPERFPTIERSSYDLVEKMHYLFIRVVKARYLAADANPFVKISVSGTDVRSKTARRTTLHLFEWDQTFAFGGDTHESASTLDVSVWDAQSSSAAPSEGPDAGAGTGGDNFLGGVCFDVAEIPMRDPPDSPLAPQWYMLEGGGAHRGNLMLATWMGTQADESFSNAWKTDTNGRPDSRSKVYMSPKLWYLRATILQAQDLRPLKDPSVSVRVQLGLQAQKTRSATSRNGSPTWNEDVVLVAAEPFGDQHLLLSVENRLGKETAFLGAATIPLASVERRVDDMKVGPRWFDLDNPAKGGYNGRLQVRVCFDGGYHVSDEPAHVASDYRPTARQLWKPPVGTVELGLVGCRNLLPVKTVAGKSTADAYAVAKYGEKWVRTRTVTNSLDPKWNEQFTWQVFDPCTVLTIAVFDSADDATKDVTRQEFRIGKIRIRISTLESGTVYRNSYPLLLMLPAGVKKMGEIEIAVRFASATSAIDMLHVYARPMLPLMHILRPIGAPHLEVLRQAAARVVAEHLARAEPPLQREVVLHVLDADTCGFSMRRVRANWFRIIGVASRAVDLVRWIEDVRKWRNPMVTMIVHVLLVLLVWHPDLVCPTAGLYAFAIGAWNRRVRTRVLNPQPCPKMSQAESVDREELDEEFDPIPSGRVPEVVRARYDRIRMLGARVQTVLGDVAAQGERVQALLTWRDPRATGIFIGLCFMVSLLMYVVPMKMVAVAGGFYYLRHPLFRDRMPSPALNFFRRLPSLSDRMM